MSSGGSGPKPQALYQDPVTGHTYWTVDALNEAINARQADEYQKGQATIRERQAKEGADRTAFTTRKEGALQQARGSAQSYLRGYGVDPDKYQGGIEEMLLQRSNLVPDLDPNPIGTFGNVGSDFLTRETLARSTKAQGDIDRMFGLNYSQSALGDDLVGGIRDNILSEQFDPLTSQLLTAHKRGTLNPTGYQSALRALDSAKSRASSEIGSIAGNELTSARRSVDDYIGNAKSQVGGWSLPQLESFDPSNVTQGVQRLVGSLTQGLGGRVRSGVGDAKFVDLTELLNAGGAAQGAIDPTLSANPTTLALLGGGDTTRRRNVGSVGAF